MPVCLLVGGILSQLKDDREVMIAYASHSLRLSLWRNIVRLAGGSGDVYAFPVVSAGGSDYPPYGP